MKLELQKSRHSSLTTCLGAVHREPQGYESDKFLLYFKPCIIPMEVGIASGFKKPEEEKFETRLYICNGKGAIRVKEVPFSRSSLNHDDVFIFNGANSNIQERAKTLEVMQHLKEKYHDGVCNVAIVDDGKLQAESDSGELWVIFGGFAPIGKNAVSDDDFVLETNPPKIYRECQHRGTEEGRGKFTVLQQKGIDVKGISKSSAPVVNGEVPPLLDAGGKLEVWYVNGSAKTALRKEELGKFYRGDCYVVLYTYHSGDKKVELHLTYWIGKHSVQENQDMAFQIANTLWNSLKGRPVLVPW